MDGPFPTGHTSVTSAGEWTVQTAVLVLAIAILAIIAYGDMRTRRIPNALAVAIAMLGLVRIILVDDLVAAGQTLAAGTAVFAAAFLLFSRGIVGGGDAKLVAATALLIGYHDLFGFLFLMSLCGVPLALAVLARDKLGPWLRRLSHHPAMPPVATTGAPMRSTVPYGAAIAAAGVIVLILGTS
jgi:prepilin peptidase CpaA